MWLTAAALQPSCFSSRVASPLHVTYKELTKYPLEQSDSGILFLYGEKWPASRFAPENKIPLSLCSWGYSVHVSIVS